MSNFIASGIRVCVRISSEISSVWLQYTYASQIFSGVDQCSVNGRWIIGLCMPFVFARHHLRPQCGTHREASGNHIEA